MKLRGVERAAAEAVDTIPPPHLTTLASAISGTQHPALCRAREDCSGRETRAGRGGFTNRPQPSRNYN